MFVKTVRGTNPQNIEDDLGSISLDNDGYLMFQSEVKGNAVVSLYVKGNGSITLGDESFQTNNNWTRFAFKTVVDIGDYVKIKFTQGTYLIYEAQLEVGTIPTDWHESEEETQEKIDAVDEKADNLDEKLEELTTIEDGKTVIDGGKIKTNSILAKSIIVDEAFVNSIFAQDITAKGTITGATLKGGGTQVEEGMIGDFEIARNEVKIDFTDYTSNTTPFVGKYTLNNDGSVTFKASGNITMCVKPIVYGGGGFKIKASDVSIIGNARVFISSCIAFNVNEHTSTIYYDGDIEKELIGEDVEITEDEILSAASSSENWYVSPAIRIYAPANTEVTISNIYMTNSKSLSYGSEFLLDGDNSIFLSYKGISLSNKIALLKRKEKGVLYLGNDRENGILLMNKDDISNLISVYLPNKTGTLSVNEDMQGLITTASHKYSPVTIGANNKVNLSIDVSTSIPTGYKMLSAYCRGTGLNTVYSYYCGMTDATTVGLDLKNTSASSTTVTPEVQLILVKEEFFGYEG